MEVIEKGRLSRDQKHKMSRLHCLCGTKFWYCICSNDNAYYDEASQAIKGKCPRCGAKEGKSRVVNLDSPLALGGRFRLPDKVDGNK